MLRLILFAVCLILSVRSQCPASALYYPPSDRCFFLNTNPLNFQDAKNYCRSIGGFLASIHSDDENWFIYNNTRSVSSSPYIGLSLNVYIESNFTWDDGTPLDYTNWGDGQPNTLFASYCVSQWPKEKWYSSACSGRFGAPSWCEVPKVTVTVPSIKTTVTTVPRTNSPQYCIPSNVYNGTCFVTVNSTASWTNARNDCIRRGGDLVSIHNQQQNQFISNVNHAVFWTGLNKIGAKNFTWSDGSPVNYEAWSWNSPGACSSGPQDCMSFSPTPQTWFNCWPCEHELPYICEIPTGSGHKKEMGEKKSKNPLYSPYRMNE